MTREEASPNTIMLVCEWVLKKRWIQRDSGKDLEYYPKTTLQKTLVTYKRYDLSQLGIYGVSHSQISARIT